MSFNRSSLPLSQRVFQLLADQQFHSGTQLAAACGVSRSAIWKATVVLRALGVTVHAVSHRGYRLPLATSPLEALHIQSALPAQVAARLRLEFYGTTYAAPALAVPRTTALVAARGLEAQVSEHPVRVPYARALALADGADGNLVLGDTTAYYAASKLMPVVAARRPVIAVLQTSTEPAALLRRLGCRGLVCYGTADTPSPGTAVDDIASALNDLIQGTLPAMTADFSTDAALQSRTAERMTGALAAVLDRASGETVGGGVATGSRAAPVAMVGHDSPAS